MANTIIQIRSSGVTGNVPQTLQPGEIAINYVDGILFYGNSSNQPVILDTITEPAGLDTELQFNDSGSFGGDSKLTFNKSTGILSTQLLTVSNSSGDEGGEILLSKPQSNTTLDGTGITIDAYRNKLRFFEQGGSARGAYLDLTEAAGGVGTNLLNPAAASYANSAYLHANSAYAYANALSGGTATDGVARSIANSAYTQANASYSQSNTATQDATSAGDYANSAFDRANNISYTFTGDSGSLSTAAGSLVYILGGTGLSSTVVDAMPGTMIELDIDNSVLENISSAGVYANAAFAKANTISLSSLSNSSYSITLSETGNLVVQSPFIIEQDTGEGPAYYSFINGAFSTPQINFTGSPGTTPNTFISESQLGSYSDNFNVVFYNTGKYWSFNSNGSILFSDDTWQSTAFTGYATDNIATQYAQSAGSYANSAYSQANTATTNAATADQRAVTSGSYANSAYTKANTAYIDATSAGSYANSAYTKANNALANTTGTFAGSLTLTGNLIATSITTTGSSGDISGANVVYANTFTANTQITTPSLQVTGDTTITGNLTVSGATTYANTTTVNLGDNIITLNADIPQASAPSENAGIEVDRGSSANVQLIWNESTDKWTFTNDGTNYSNIGSSASESYANSAYSQANTATTNAATADQRAVTSGSYANSAYLHANSAFEAANNATDTWVRNAANSAGSYANSAYTQANTATQYAQSAGDYANSAYTQANTAATNAATADQRAVTSGSYANSAYLHANSAFNAANNATDTWVRNAANSASSYANSSYSQANTANILAQAAFDQANTGGGSSTDSWARNQANAAFTKANTLFVGDETLTTNTANQVIDSYSTTEYRTAKYIVQAISGADVHSEEILVTHNDTDAFFTEYAIVTTSNSLFNVYATVQSSNVTVNVSPVNSETQIDFSRIGIIARILSSLEGDLMLLSGTEDLETASGAVDLMS